MAQVSIPDELFRKIAGAMPALSSAEQFVIDAVREKLRWCEHRDEFYRLTDRARQAMAKTGTDEAALIEDFNTFRDQLNS